jgi:hypothetical protein
VGHHTLRHLTLGEELQGLPTRDCQLTLVTLVHSLHRIRETSQALDVPTPIPPIIPMVAQVMVVQGAMEVQAMKVATAVPQQSVTRPTHIIRLTSVINQVIIQVRTEFHQHPMKRLQRVLL